MSDMSQQTQIGFPFQLDGRGRVADPGYLGHIDQMIELVLFTVPGERVNRPDFGCGLLRDIFEVNSETNVAIIERGVEASLQKWLGDLVRTSQMTITMEENQVDVVIEYQVIETGEIRNTTFSSGPAL